VSGAAWQRSGLQEIQLVRVQRDGADGESFSITGPSVTLGRIAGDLRFPHDEFLGSFHARIERTEHGLSVVDLNSVNGVYLRLSTPEPVYPGDVFLLGHQLLRLENVPESGREHEPAEGGVRIFGTPLPPAWGRLVLLGYGGCEAETYFLRPRQVVFGRELGDILYPADAFISRRHASLSMELHGEAMSVMLEDLESANGTYLRVRGSAHLENGDMFRVGDQIFRVKIL
jgi:pSer/pThr/pTyr-binding forkhead associated (FHA) protein